MESGALYREFQAFEYNSLLSLTSVDQESRGIKKLNKVM